MSRFSAEMAARMALVVAEGNMASWRHTAIATLSNLTLEDWLGMYAGTKDITLVVAAVFAEINNISLEWLVFGTGERRLRRPAEAVAAETAA